MNRVLRAGRMHLVHPLVILGIPWLVVGISFAINVAVWHLTPAGEDLLEELGAAYKRRLAALLCDISPPQAERLRQLLTLIDLGTEPRDDL